MGLWIYWDAESSADGGARLETSAAPAWTRSIRGKKPSPQLLHRLFRAFAPGESGSIRSQNRGCSGQSRHRLVPGRIIQDETSRFQYHGPQAGAQQSRPLEALEHMPPGQFGSEQAIIHWRGFLGSSSPGQNPHPTPPRAGAARP